jgi:hypothetical protein
MPDGKERAGIRGATTPLDVANEISKSLAKKCVVAKVDGADWDLFRPMEGDCTLQFFSFDDAEGRDVGDTPPHPPTYRTVLRSNILGDDPSRFWTINYRGTLTWLDAAYLARLPSSTRVAHTTRTHPFSHLHLHLPPFTRTHRVT